MQNIIVEVQNLFLTPNEAQSSDKPIMNDDLAHELMTPQKRNAKEKDYSTTILSNIYLTPLVPAAKLNYWLIQPQQTLDLVVIQTPCRNKLNSFNAMIDQDSHDSKPHHSIQTKYLFEKDDIDENQYESAGLFGQQTQKQNSEDEQNEKNDSEEFYEFNPQRQDQDNVSTFRKQQQSNFLNFLNEDQTSKKLTCNCKKTKCLKLYCDCFREGQQCGQACQCIGCHNTQEYNVQMVEVKQQLNKRNSQAFRPKIEGKQHSKGCNCKQTHCLKKYCECFQAGIGCGQHCKCEGCENGPGQLQKYACTVRKQRRMRQY